VKATFEEDDLNIITEKVITVIKPLLKLKESDDECFLSKEDAARLLGVKMRWLENNQEKLDIPRYRIGGHIRFKKSELIKWASKHKVFNP
jgi:excisionase family DNA binding protein